MVQSPLVMLKALDLTSGTQKAKQKILSCTMCQDLVVAVSEPQTVAPTLVTFSF